VSGSTLDRSSAGRDAEAQAAQDHVVVRREDGTGRSRNRAVQWVRESPGGVGALGEDVVDAARLASRRRGHHGKSSVRGAAGEPFAGPASQGP